MASLKTQPEFESQTDTATKENTMHATTEHNQAAASVAATTAIAKAASTAVGSVGKFAIAYAELNGVFDNATVEGLALATPRIKAEQGSLFKGEEDLGGAIRIEPISFNHRWTISTGETDTESKEFFRVTYDKQTTNKGENVEDYIASLKAQGFDKAEMSPYMDIFGLIVWSEKKGEVEPELVCLQAAKVSTGKWSAFCATQGILVSRGLAEQASVVEVYAEKLTSGSNKYTAMNFRRPK